MKLHITGGDVSAIELYYDTMARPEWTLSQASSYARPFARKIYAGFWEDLMPNTVLADDMWMTLYRMADYVSYNYRRGLGLKLPTHTQPHLVLLAETSDRFFCKVPENNLE